MYGFDFYRDPLGASRPGMTFDDFYKAGVDAKPKTTSRQKALLESRYVLKPKLDPKATMSRNCYLAAPYRRLVKRRGDKKAIVAVAHSILIIAYHVLRDGVAYRELGGDYFDRLNTDRLRRYHTKRLAALGYAVTLTKSAA